MVVLFTKQSSTKTKKYLSYIFMVNNGLFSELTMTLQLYLRKFTSFSGIFSGCCMHVRIRQADIMTCVFLFIAEQKNRSFRCCYDTSLIYQCINISALIVMPALVACGRTWEFGSDDVFFPGVSAVTVHSIWLLGMLGGVVYFRDGLGCEPSHYLVGFSSSLLFITLCGILLELMITILSARGSIVREKPRRPIVHLMHARVLVVILEVILLIIGTVFVFKSRQEIDLSDCPGLRKALTMMQVVVAGYWFAFIMLVLVVVIYLDPCHCYSAKVNYRQVTQLINKGNIDQEVVATQWKLVHTVWEKRFKVLCCLAGSDDVHHLAYREVAEIFAHLFCDTNVVMSDIAAGFILLQKEEIALDRAKRSGTHPRRHSGCSNDTNGELSFSFDFHVQEDRELFQDAVHFLKFALGMYSWPIYMYMNPFCGLCRLYSHLNCCGRHNQAEHIHKDNRCSCYMGGLRQVTGLDEMDVIYASFESDVYKVPFTVCLDHETKSVVLAYRGTLSFGDIVTDLTASTRPIELPDFPNFLVHKGMLKTVTAVMEKLEEDQILDSAFGKVAGYKLVVVGHSLGSGCACLTAILLREKYPDVRCFCYSPTGALLNEAAAEYTEEFVTSITLGKDMVARLNVPNTHKLKEDLVRVIESCPKPKCRILMEGCLETLSTCFGGSVVFDESRESEIVVKKDDDQPDTAINIEADTDNECIDHIESNPLLVSAEEIDPEQSLPFSGHSHAISTMQPSNPASSLYQHDRTEWTPIFHPRLSSLRLPVRGTGRTSPSPVSSLSTEIERRLVPLFPPGKILHIVDTSETKPCFCASRQLVVKWASRHDFNRMSVSPDMVRDHFPDVISRAMNTIWNRKLADIEDSEIRKRHRVHSI